MLTSGAWKPANVCTDDLKSYINAHFSLCLVVFRVVLYFGIGIEFLDVLFLPIIKRFLCCIQIHAGLVARKWVIIQTRRWLERECIIVVIGEFEITHWWAIRRLFAAECTHFIYEWLERFGFAHDYRVFLWNAGMYLWNLCFRKI